MNYEHDPYNYKHITEEERVSDIQYVQVYPMLQNCCGKHKHQTTSKTIKLLDYNFCMQQMGIDINSYGYLYQLRQSKKFISGIPFKKTVVFCGNCLYSWKESRSLKNMPTTKCSNCGDIITWRGK